MISEVYLEGTAIAIRDPHSSYILGKDEAPRPPLEQLEVGLVRYFPRTVGLGSLS